MDNSTKHFFLQNVYNINKIKNIKWHFTKIIFQNNLCLVFDYSDSDTKRTVKVNIYNIINFQEYLKIKLKLPYLTNVFDNNIFDFKIIKSSNYLFNNSKKSEHINEIKLFIYTSILEDFFSIYLHDENIFYIHENKLWKNNKPIIDELYDYDLKIWNNFIIFFKKKFTDYLYIYDHDNMEVDYILLVDFKLKIYDMEFNLIKKISKNRCNVTFEIMDNYIFIQIRSYLNMDFDNNTIETLIFDKNLNKINIYKLKNFTSIKDSNLIINFDNNDLVLISKLKPHKHHINLNDNNKLNYYTFHNEHVYGWENGKIYKYKIVETIGEKIRISKIDNIYKKIYSLISCWNKNPSFNKLPRDCFFQIIKVYLFSE